MKEEFYFPSRDGIHRIHGVRWIPEGEITGVLQLTHGMCEFIERYEPFAQYCAQAGYLVVGHDHLGHGKSVKNPSELGYFTKEHPAETLIEDMHRIREMTRAQYPDVPYFMMGHSMGSYLLRMYIAFHGRGLAGAVVMGTGYVNPKAASFGMKLSTAIALVKGWHHRSPVVQDLAMGAGSYRKFSLDGSDPANSWLSRNEENVKAYYSDPLCGFPFTLNGFYGLFQTVHFVCAQKNVNKVPAKLPVLFVSGQNDPVGDLGKGVERSCRMFRDAGVADVTMKLYPDDRHELLNETDRDRVFEDILGWMEARR